MSYQAPPPPPPEPGPGSQPVAPPIYAESQGEQQYGHPAYGQPYAPPQPSPNGLAIASLVCGILGLTFFFGIGSILALVFGYISKRQIATSQGREGGRGMAVAGLVLGWIGVIIGLVFLAMMVIGIVLAVQEGTV